MSKVLIVYYSRSGNTEKMSELIEEGVKSEGLEVIRKRVEDTKVDELLSVDAVIMGSPDYYGTMAYELKKFLDESVKFHGKLDGKVGAAFSSSANIGGGNETTILGIINVLLIHGMVVQGDPQGDHYGPVSIASPDERAAKECKRLGQRVARLIKRLSGTK